MNGTFLESFHANNTIPHLSVFKPVSQDHSRSNLSSPATQCDTGNELKIVHYCNTHWNAPVYLSRSGCLHMIEWHSPLRCHPDSVNNEHPCYTYDTDGRLIDLTSWIWSNGSSYNVDLRSATMSNKIDKFHLNICNEAHDVCGPNVSSCYLDKQAGHVESGYNNLTSIKYDIRDKIVLLTSLGQFRKNCEDDRIRTVTRFVCKKNTTPQTGPKLIRSTACENIIEWSTIRACPISEVSAPATECKIKYEPLGIDIDIMKLTSNRTSIEVPNIDLDGPKKMVLGICRGLPKSLTCEGKVVSTTGACLLDATDNSISRAANNSKIVGSVTKSFVRLSDDRVYLESFTHNKTCTESTKNNINVTRKVGTRLEFYCSAIRQEVPTFLGYDDCVYVFELGTPLMCLETFTSPSNRTETFDETKSVILEDEIHLKNDDGVLKSDAIKKQVTNQEGKQPASVPVVINSSPKMNSAHKYFMISLILMSFVAFIVIIIVLDKKTRLRVTLRQARQVFQSNEQPYSRVVNDLNL